MHCLQMTRLPYVNFVTNLVRSGLCLKTGPAINHLSGTPKICCLSEWPTRHFPNACMASPPLNLIKLGSFHIWSFMFSFYDIELWLYIYIYIYVWKLNQTVLELDFRAVKFLFFPRRDLNPHHCYTAAPFA